MADISRDELVKLGVPLGDAVMIERAGKRMLSYPCCACWNLGETSCSREGECEHSSKAARSCDIGPVLHHDRPPAYKRTIPAVLPTWDPDTTPGTAKDFITKLKLAFSSQNYDPAKWHIALALQMRGKAEAWGTRIAKNKKLTWKNAKAQFLDMNTAGDERADKWRMYHNISQGAKEKVRDYANRFQALAEDIERSQEDEETIQRFVRGLKSDIRVRVRVRGQG